MRLFGEQGQQSAVGPGHADIGSHSAGVGTEVAEISEDDDPGFKAFKTEDAAVTNSIGLGRPARIVAHKAFAAYLVGINKEGIALCTGREEDNVFRTRAVSDYFFNECLEPGQAGRAIAHLGLHMRPLHTGKFRKRKHGRDAGKCRNLIGIATIAGEFEKRGNVGGEVKSVLSALTQNALAWVFKPNPLPFLKPPRNKLLRAATKGECAAMSWPSSRREHPTA